MTQELNISEPTLDALEQKRKEVEEYRAVLERYSKKNNTRWYYYGRDQLQQKEEELKKLEEAFRNVPC